MQSWSCLTAEVTLKCRCLCREQLLTRVVERCRARLRRLSSSASLIPIQCGMSICDVFTLNIYPGWTLISFTTFHNRVLISSVITGCKLYSCKFCSAVCPCWKILKLHCKMYIYVAKGWNEPSGIGVCFSIWLVDVWCVIALIPVVMPTMIIQQFSPCHTVAVVTVGNAWVVKQLLNIETSTQCSGSSWCYSFPFVCVASVWTVRSVRLKCVHSLSALATAHRRLLSAIPTLASWQFFFELPHWLA